MLDYDADQVLDQVLGKQVMSVYVVSETLIILKLRGLDQALHMIAKKECYDYSFFTEKEGKFTDLVNKTITGVKCLATSKTQVSPRPNNYDDNRDFEAITAIQIDVKDSSPFIFYLHNLSNGYYSGYLSLELNDTTQKLV